MCKKSMDLSGNFNLNVVVEIANNDLTAAQHMACVNQQFQDKFGFIYHVRFLKNKNHGVHGETRSYFFYLFIAKMYANETT